MLKSWLTVVLGIALFFALACAEDNPPVDPEDTEDTGADADTDGDTDTDVDTDTDADTDTDSDVDTDADTDGCALNVLETFDDSIPGSWTIQDGGSGTETWRWDNDLGLVGGSGVAGGYALVNCADAPGETGLDEWLISPVFSASGCSDLNLDLEQHFSGEGILDDYGEIMVRVNGGIWESIYANVFTKIDFLETSLNDWVGNGDTFEIGFHYFGGAGVCGYWLVDSVQLVGT